LAGGLSPLHSLRRRWAQMLCAGTVCALILSAGAWYFFQPKFRTYASLRIHSETPHLAFKVNEAEQAAQFDVYKRTQKELVLGDEVLLAVLRAPTIAQSPRIRMIAQIEDPVIWLRSQLRVDFPGDAEIMSISMTGDGPAFIADVVNAVLDAYVENVIDAGKQNRSDRLAELRKVQGVQEEKARRLRNKLESLTESLGSGDKDALSVKQQVAIERFAQMQTEYARVQFQRIGAELQLARLADRLKTYAQESAAHASGGEATPGDQAPESDTVAVSPSPSPPSTESVPMSLATDVQRNAGVVAQQEVVRQAELVLEDVERRIGTGHVETVARYHAQIDREKKKLAELEDRVRADLMVQYREAEVLARRNEQSKLAKEHDELNGQVQTLKLHEKILADDLAKATEAADKIGTSSVNVELTRKELDRLEKINDSIGVDIETLTIELSSASRVEALGRARKPQAASAEDRVKKAAAFAVLGFLLPCAGLVWLDLQRKHVNSESDVERLATVRLLGSVPMVGRPRLYGRGHERGALALREAIDRIRTVLIREAELSDYRVIVITSAVGGEAKTTFAAQLARSLARAHRRTVLVDFDLRSPSVHEVFGMPLESGTSELLRGELQADEVLRPTDQDNLWLVLGGQCDKMALAGLTNNCLAGTIGRLREAFEFVVIDTSPVLPVVDALLVAQQADAIILTALRDVSRAPQLAEARERLRQVGANVVGSVITTKGQHSYYETSDRYAVHSG
jgi:capsular exopolysaccharide synthesis family protein